MIRTPLIALLVSLLALAHLAAAQQEADAPAPREEPAEVPLATRIAFISLEGMVGPSINRETIEQSIEALDMLPELQRPEIVVFELDSGGGGAFDQIDPIATYIHQTVKPKYRVVMWVRSATRDACAIAWVAEEIYMNPDGHIGAMGGSWGELNMGGTSGLSSGSASPSGASIPRK